MEKYRIVMTCWDYGAPEKPYTDNVNKFFDTKEAAQEALQKAVKDELETLNEGRELVPVEDSDGNVVGHDYDFRADDAGGEYDNVIRFWDGADYQEVTGYNIHPVDFMELAGGKISEHSCCYRGFEIYANSKHNRFKIEGAYDTVFAMKHTLASALKWVDDFCLDAKQARIQAKTKKEPAHSSLESMIRNAEAKTAPTAHNDPAPTIESER